VHGVQSCSARHLISFRYHSICSMPQCKPSWQISEGVKGLATSYSESDKARTYSPGSSIQLLQRCLVEKLRVFLFERREVRCLLFLKVNSLFQILWSLHA
jgi:hypothetical protein